MKTILLMAGLIISATGCQTTVTTHGIPNLAEVEPGVWRGGQPTAEGFAYLKSLGVQNIIKLNEEREGSDEAAWTAGMWVYEVPITFAQQMGLQPIPKAFGMGYKSNVGGTFIHCSHGQDRTGLFVAMWRVRFDGWPKADAEKEMLEHGFHRELRGLWEYWEQYQRE